MLCSVFPNLTPSKKKTRQEVISFNESSSFVHNIAKQHEGNALCFWYSDKRKEDIMALLCKTYLVLVTHKEEVTHIKRYAGGTAIDKDRSNYIIYSDNLVKICSGSRKGLVIKDDYIKEGERAESVVIYKTMSNKANFNGPTFKQSSKYDERFLKVLVDNLKREITPIHVFNKTLPLFYIADRNVHNFNLRATSETKQRLLDWLGYTETQEGNFMSMTELFEQAKNNTLCVGHGRNALPINVCTGNGIKVSEVTGDHVYSIEPEFINIRNGIIEIDTKI